jgi:cobalt/nickel transport system permease protein
VHIPDGYLDPYICIATYLVAVIVVILSFRKIKDLSDEKKTLIPVLAAAIFVAQMLNWPIPGGTSLHLVGGALATILVGPWGGNIVLTLVLLVQALVFHDGGITTLGANILNMGIVAVWTGWLIYKYVPNKKLATFLAGWLSITFAGIVAGLELGLSKQFLYGLSITIPVMGSWHAVLGIIEGIITMGVYMYMANKYPGLVSG